MVSRAHNLTGFSLWEKAIDLVLWTGPRSYRACNSRGSVLWSKKIATISSALFAEHLDIRQLGADRRAFAHRELVAGQVTEAAARSDMELLQEHSLCREPSRDIFHEKEWPIFGGFFFRELVFVQQRGRNRACRAADRGRRRPLLSEVGRHPTDHL